MTAACRGSFEDKARSRTAADINSIQAVTAISTTSPGATPLPGDQAVTDRVITSASADLATDQRLTFTVASSARVHFKPNTGGTPFYSLITHSTTYTLVPQSGAWLVDAWQGT